MSMGSWCLSAFSALAFGALAADLLGRRAAARAASAATALSGLYLASYTGILLSGTAVPVWARSRALLPPIFVCTATASGAAATRLALAALAQRPDHPAQDGLRAVEAAAMAGELLLSGVDEKRLGRLGRPLEEGRAGRLLSAARWGTRAGLALRLAGRRAGAAGDHAASALFAVAALAYRFGWVEAGKASARDHEGVALMARERRAGATPARDAGGW
jgi:hypothetical protein